MGLSTSIVSFVVNNQFVADMKKHIENIHVRVLFNIVIFVGNIIHAAKI